MNTDLVPEILCVDDDPDTLLLLERLLTARGFKVRCANGAEAARALLRQFTPALILLDVIMPGVNGYELCAELGQQTTTAFTPIIFLTALGDEQDQLKAFAMGAVDYLIKPTKPDLLVQKVSTHLATARRWQVLRSAGHGSQLQGDASDFNGFKNFLAAQFAHDPVLQYKLYGVRVRELYADIAQIKLTPRQLAREIAIFFKLRYLPHIGEGDILLGEIPTKFCRERLVVPLRTPHPTPAFAVCNPFDIELLDLLRRMVNNRAIALAITEPETIETIFAPQEALEAPSLEIQGEGEPTYTERIIITAEAMSSGSQDIEQHPISYIANLLLEQAVGEHASDIHIEAKEGTNLIRFRIDGELFDRVTLKRATGRRLISHLKALAGLDVVNQRKPQDGALSATIHAREFNFRLATTSTPDGESLVIRILEPTARIRTLAELGMSSLQAARLEDYAKRPQGLFLVVGPTGAGKTSTLYSTIALIDVKARSLVSIEDPIEYRIAYAHQQQIHEKMGLTMETLLKSVVRQDPDILFLGEIRDQYSAKMCIDFASTGHLTMSSLHTANATTALFRLERLGLARWMMAEALLGVVAQRLVKKLCPYCKKVTAITDEERSWLIPFLPEPPMQVAHPKGCPKCQGTGYTRREGIFEIMHVDPEIATLIRDDVPIAEIREAMVRNGEKLLSHQAAQKVADLILDPRDAYEKVLIEEMRAIPAATPAPVTVAVGKLPPTPLPKIPALPTLPDEPELPPTPLPSPQRSAPAPAPVMSAPAASLTATASGERPWILLVDADAQARVSLAEMLERVGYQVHSAADGIEALMHFSARAWRLMIADLNVPSVGGYQLLEIITQKGLGFPVILMSSDAGVEDEIKALELGAADFLRKPLSDALLRARVRKLVP
jgi:type II secretory ATPase GspE/PulE/Tfp pilus assembly ATPase PilB-like protein/DNA-binding response OmpR family regulator